MQLNGKCVVWDTPFYSANDEAFTFFNKNTNNPPPFFRKLSNLSHKYEVYNPRSGGKYILERWLLPSAEFNIVDQDDKNITRKLTDKEKVYLSGYIAKENLKNRIPPIDFITKDNNWIEKLLPIPNPDKRAILLLKGLISEYPTVGSVIPLNLNTNISLNVDLNTEKDITPFLYALSYCSTEGEFQF